MQAGFSETHPTRCPSAMRLAIEYRRLRQLLNRIVTGAPFNETFRACYRANTQRSLRRIRELLGLANVRIEYLSDHPEYMMFSPLLYRMAVLAEQTILRRRRFA